MQIDFDIFDRLCVERGKSQSAVGDESGVSKNAIGRWRRNETNPSRASIAKLAAYFGVSIDTLLKGEAGTSVSGIKNSVVLQNTTGNNTVSNGDMRTDAGSTNQLSEQELEILRIFRELPLRGQNEMMTLIFQVEDKYKAV